MQRPQRGAALRHFLANPQNLAQVAQSESDEAAFSSDYECDFGIGTDYEAEAEEEDNIEYDDAPPSGHNHKRKRKVEAKRSIVGKDREPRAKKHRIVQLDAISIPAENSGRTSRWHLVKDTARSLWPVYSEGDKATIQKKFVFNTLMSLDAMYHAKWFQDLPMDISELSEVEMSALKDTIITAAHMVSNLVKQTFMKQAAAELILWIRFCNVNYDGNYGVTAIPKIRDFIYFRVAAALSEAKERLNINEKEHTSWNAARHVPHRIGHLAQIQGYFNMEDVGAYPMISTVVKSYQIDKNVAHGDVKPHDFARRTNARNITQEQMKALTEAFWDGVTDNDFINMRCFILYMMNRTAGRRSHELRELFMGSFQLRASNVIEPVKATHVLASLHKMKMTAGDFIIPWLRTADPMECPIGAIANYMVYMIDIEKHPIFDTMRRDLIRALTWGGDADAYHAKWWAYTFVFPSKTEGGDRYTKAICYNTHAKTYKLAADMAEIRNKRSVLHMARHILALLQAERGIPITDIAKHQHWSTAEVSNAMDHYINDAVLSTPVVGAHGWHDKNSYFCWREDDTVPADLNQHVMRELDSLLDLSEKVYNLKGLDLSAREFLRCLQFLRKVYLQDAVIMQPLKPNFPAFNHMVFKTAVWQRYADAEPALTLQREEAHFAKKQDPETAKMLTALDKKARRDRAHMDNNLKEIKDLIAQIPAKPVPMATQEPAPAPTPFSEQVKVKDIVPNIAEVCDLQHLLTLWVSEWRPYFSTTANPNWKGTFGKDRTHVERWRKVEATCLYIDYIAKEQGLSEKEVVRRLQLVCSQVGIGERDFIIQEVRGMCQGYEDKSGKRAAVLQAFDDVQLPHPTLSAKDMRSSLWDNRCQKAKRKAGQKI